MAKDYIKVYDESSTLKERINKVRGNYSLTLWCHQQLEKAVAREEKKQTNRFVEGR
ncbi:MAG: hypothetical protein GY787_27530 [Alteromonadales bacterium]|nr:hypothetical protein [Alteromonadales bacterium]